MQLFTENKIASPSMVDAPLLREAAPLSIFYENPMEIY